MSYTGDPEEQYRELQKQAQEAHRHIKELEISSEWRQNGTNPCQKYTMNDGDRMAAKGVSIVSHNIQRVFDFLYEESSLKKLIPQLKQIRRIYEKDSLRVNYQLYNTPWPIAPRQFIVLAAKIRESPTKVYISCKSCNFHYAETEGQVRGELVVGGYIMQQIDLEHTKVTYISESDFKGNIPQMIQNKASADQAQVASRIAQAMIDSGL